MSAAHFLRVSWRTLWHSPTTFLLQILVIFVNTMLIVGVSFVFSSLTRGVENFTTQLAGSARLVVVAGEASSMSEVDIARLGDIPSVHGVMSVAWTDADIDGRSTLAIGIGVLGDVDMLGMKKDEVVLVNCGTNSCNDTSKELNLSVGRTQVKVSPADIAKIGNYPSSLINQGNFVAMPMDFYRTLTPSKPRALFLYSDDKARDADVIADVQDVVGGGYSVLTVHDYAAQLSGTYAMLSSVASIFMVISLIGGIVLVYIITTIEVHRRRYQYVSLRLIGASRKRIMWWGGLEGIIVFVPIIIVSSIAGVWLAGVLINMLPPALTSAVPVTPAVHRDVWQWAGYVVGIAAFTLFARQVALMRILKRVDNGLVYVRAEGMPRSLNVTVLSMLGVLAAVVGVIGVVTGRHILFAFSLAICLPIVVFAVGRVCVKYGVRAQKNKAIACILAGRSMNENMALAFLIAISVASVVAASLSSFALIQRADETVASLLEHDYYLQSSSADELPTAPMMTLDEARRLTENSKISSVAPGVLLDVSLDGGAYTLQGVSRGTTMPAALNAGEEAVTKMLNGEGVIVSRKAAQTLNVDVGDYLTLPATGKSEFTILGISDYIGVNDGQIVASMDTLCDANMTCMVSYVEIDALGVSLSKNDFSDYTFIVDDDNLFLNTSEDENAALSRSISSTAVLSLVLVLMVVFVGFVGVVAIYRTMMENQKVTRQAMEKIGIRHRDVTRIYVVRSLIFTAVTACIGVLIGLLSSVEFSSMLENMLSISGVSHYGYPVVTILVSLVSIMVFCFAALLGVYIGVKNYHNSEKD